MNRLGRMAVAGASQAGPSPTPGASSFALAAIAEAGGLDHRRAALLLHALSPQDRSWVLDALAPVQREALSELLAELQALDIARDPALIDQVLQSPASTARPLNTSLAVDDVGGEDKNVQIGDEAFLMRLRTPHQVQAVCAALSSEPVALIAYVLCLADWPWRDALMQSLTLPARRDVGRLLHETREPLAVPVPPRLRAALLQALCASVRQAPVVSMPAQPTGAGRRWTAWLQRGGNRQVAHAGASQP